MESYNTSAAKKLRTPTIQVSQPKKTTPLKREQVKISHVNEHELLHTQRPQIMKKVSVIVAIVLILSYILYLRVVQAEVDSTYGKVQKQYSELTSEQVRMQMELEALTANDTFETEVESKYGLQKVTEEQIQYVDLEGSNKIVIPEK